MNLTAANRTGTLCRISDHNKQAKNGKARLSRARGIENVYNYLRPTYFPPPSIPSFSFSFLINKTLNKLLPGRPKNICLSMLP